MGHFEELCALSAAVEEKQRDVETLIKREAVRLVSFWKRWLGLPAEHWVDDNGEAVSYISTGYIDSNSELHLVPVEDIPVGMDGTLEMELRTCVGANNKRPTTRVSVSLQVISVGDSGIDVAVAVNGSAPIKVFVSASDEYAYGAVALCIKKHIQDELKAAYPSCLL